MSVSLSNGVLTINGTAGNDRITIQNIDKNKLRVTDNGSKRDFDASKVKTVRASLANGDDSFNAYAVGKPMTVLGGNGNDTCFGGSASDMIQGGEGNDILNGYEGADQVTGGNGTDEVQYFQHTAGVNVTLDGIANDGRYSPTNLFASIEFDNVSADVENVSGSIYNDFLFGNASNNTLNGHYGNDFVDGGAGDDALRGGYGDDTLQGGDGNDFLWGELGADLLNGGNGNDDVRYDNFEHTSGVRATLPNGGDDAVSYGNGMAGENDRIRGNVENFWGTPYKDFLNGNERANVIYGWRGDDVMTGGLGNDILYGSDGNDTLYGDGGNDSITGDAGDDLIDCGGGTDLAFGDDGNDTLLAKDGGYTDRLDGGSGIDIVSCDRLTMFNLGNVIASDAVISFESIV